MKSYLLKCFLLVVSLCPFKAQALDMSLPKPYYDKIDHHGHFMDWKEFGTANLAGVSWPIRMNFDNSNKKDSPYSGIGWSCPILESKVIFHDARHASVTLPCGRVFKFQSHDNVNEFRCLNTRKWSAKKKGNKFTMVNDDWYLVYVKGKIIRMKTSNGEATWHYDAEGILTSISDGDKHYFKLKTTKEKTTITCGLRDKTFDFVIEKKPVKTFGKLYADETLNNTGSVMTKVYLNKGPEQPEYFAITPKYFTLKLTHIYTKKEHDLGGIRIEHTAKERTKNQRLNSYTWDKQTDLVIAKDSYLTEYTDRFKMKDFGKRKFTTWFHIKLEGKKYNDFPKIMTIYGVKLGEEAMKPLSGHEIKFYHKDYIKGILREGESLAFTYKTYTEYFRTHSLFKVSKFVNDPKAKNYEAIQSFTQYLDVEITPDGFKKKKSTLELYGEYFYDTKGRCIRKCLGNQILKRNNGGFKFVELYKKNVKVVEQLFKEIKKEKDKWPLTEDEIKMGLFSKICG